MEAVLGRASPVDKKGAEGDDLKGTWRERAGQWKSSEKDLWRKWTTRDGMFRFAIRSGKVVVRYWASRVCQFERVPGENGKGIAGLAVQPGDSSRRC